MTLSTACSFVILTGSPCQYSVWLCIYTYFTIDRATVSINSPLPSGNCRGWWNLEAVSQSCCLFGAHQLDGKEVYPSKESSLIINVTMQCQKVFASGQIASWGLWNRVLRDPGFVRMILLWHYSVLHLKIQTEILWSIWGHAVCVAVGSMLRH